MDFCRCYVVSEPIGNCDRDAANYSFNLQEPARVCDWLPLSFVSCFFPKSGWELFSHWDGKWYVEIANLASQTGNPTLYRFGIVWDQRRVRLLIPPIHDLISIAGEE